MEKSSDFKSKENRAPHWLSHKPIYALNEFGKIDSEYKNNSDVAALSVGKAQWRKKELYFEPSVKVWRYTDKGGFSGQSEETTFTRAIDMAMFVIQVYAKIVKNKEFIPIDDIHGENDIEKIDYAPYNYDNELKDYLEKNKRNIEAHIKFLKKTIEQSDL